MDIGSSVCLYCFKYSLYDDAFFASDNMHTCIHVCTEVQIYVRGYPSIVIEAFFASNNMYKTHAASLYLPSGCIYIYIYICLCTYTCIHTSLL
jgi:hypothetical protein